MFERVKYEFWPFLKTRLIFWWWIVKYGGKKNIPPEVIFARMAKSMETLDQNLRCARAAMMDDATKEEMGEMYDVIGKVEDFEKKLDKIQRS